MISEPFNIENAHAGDFLTFEHDTGLKSYMIFHNTHKTHLTWYRFFVMIDGSGMIRLQGECVYLEGYFRLSTTEEKEFMLKQLRREHLIWEAAKQQLRRMTLFERTTSIFSYICRCFKGAKNQTEDHPEK